jgi:hypothetical protein
MPTAKSGRSLAAAGSLFCFQRIHMYRYMLAIGRILYCINERYQAQNMRTLQDSFSGSHDN